MQPDKDTSDPRQADTAAAPTPAESSGAESPSPAPREAYKKPSITRHGNLRMMTQLE